MYGLGRAARTGQTNRIVCPTVNSFRWANFRDRLKAGVYQDKLRGVVGRFTESFGTDFCDGTARVHRRGRSGFDPCTETDFRDVGAPDFTGSPGRLKTYPL
jgi:hypothetical protein